MWRVIIVLTMVKCTEEVRIMNLRVPEAIQYGTKDAVTLDCDFVTENVTGLVVKWFFNNRSNIVYQWIPPQRPQALGILHDKLDLTYTVSDDPYTSRRAMRILSPTPELTGNYTCVISTFLAEDERTKPMTIFVPEEKFQMIVDKLDDGFLNIICEVEGVFPQPELEIFAGNRLLYSQRILKMLNGRYTAVTSATVSDVPVNVEISCDMQVPLANYYSRKVYNRDTSPTSPQLEHSESNKSSKGSPSKGHTSHQNEAKSILYLLLMSGIIIGILL